MALAVHPGMLLWTNANNGTNERKKARTVHYLKVSSSNFHIVAKYNLQLTTCMVLHCKTKTINNHNDSYVYHI